MAVFSGNGSVGSPSFTFSSDTDSGMYRVGDNSIALGTGGVEKLTLDASGVTVNDSGAAGNAFRVKAGSVSDAFVIKSGGVGIYSDTPQAPLYVESGTGNAPGPNVLVACQAGGNGDVLGTFGFYNKASQTATNPIRAYTTATRQNGSWGANLDLYASTGTGAATRRMRLSATGATQLYDAADTEMFRLDSAGDFSFGGDVAGGNPRYIYDESLNRHIFCRSDGTGPRSYGQARLSTRGGIRIQSELGTGDGAGAWEIVPFELAASATATNIMSIDTSLGNTSNLLYGYAGFLVIQVGWIGAPNNGNRTRMYSFSALQSSFQTTLLENAQAGTPSDYTLTTTLSGGTRFFQLANNSASYSMRGSMAILLIGGTTDTFSITDRFN